MPLPLEQLLEMRVKPPPIITTTEEGKQKRRHCENVKAQRRAANKRARQHKKHIRRRGK